MEKFKDIFNKIIEYKYFNTIMFFFYELLYLVFIDFFNQYLVVRSFNINEYLINTVFIFDVIFVLFYFVILYILNPKPRKIVSCVINILLFVISIVNYFMISYFGSIFSWKDLFLSRDGFSFLSSIFKFINLKFVLFVLTSIDIIVLIFKTKTKKVFIFKSKQSIFIFSLLLILMCGRILFIDVRLNNADDGWNFIGIKNNDSNYYQNWVEPTRLIRICGIYEYLISDFYNSFLKSNNVVAADNYVKEYLNNNYVTDVVNDYTGIFKNKNLIFVMMESMDDWMVNEEVTPTIYEMMKHGFNFNNHYSPSYVTGETVSTEFIANTGMYPIINKLSPNYTYVNNNYSYSIANLFKNNGYVTNSFHKSSGYIYNRGNMHLSLGYTKYYNSEDIGISDENSYLDSYIISDGYNKIVQKNSKFMSFIITYSPHSPYTYDKVECTTNLDDIKGIYPDIDNEEYLCGYSAARETDNMFKLLLEKLKEDDLLDDTIIVAFSDHPNKIIIRDDETEKLNKIKFFIYSSDMDSNQIETITSSINILPTVLNLFGIDTEYLYTGYDALNTNEEYVIFRDYTYYDGTDIKEINEYLQEKLEYSFDMLISDYYRNDIK